jgi:hypothetical protein
LSGVEFWVRKNKAGYCLPFNRERNMPNQTLADVWQMIQSLKPAERQQLRAWLDEPPVEAPSSPEQEVERILFERGVIATLPDRQIDVAVFESWKPVTAEGKPVSEILIEDRR